MKIYNMIIFIFIFCLSLLSCSPVVNQSQSTGSDTNTLQYDSNTGVGTVVNNPVEPELKIGEIFPEWDKLVMMPDFSFDFVDLIKNYENLGNNNESKIKNYLTLIEYVLTSLMHEYQLFEGFGKAVAYGLESQGIEIVSQDFINVTFNMTVSELESDEFVEKINSVDIGVDSVDTQYVRFYLRDKLYNKVFGTYLVTMDDAGRPTKGLFAYVPERRILEPQKTQGKGMTALAFDMSQEQYTFIVRKEMYHKQLKRFGVTQDLVECDPKTKKCVAEHLDIISKAPIREFDQNNIRFSWGGVNPVYCLTKIEYLEDNVKVLPGIMIDTNQMSVSYENCQVIEPDWSEQIFKTEDLFYRYFDTSPAGGSAAKYYIDGESLEGWDLFTSQTIDEWLHQYAY